MKMNQLHNIDWHTIDQHLWESEQVVINEVMVKICFANLSFSEFIMKLPKPMTAGRNGVIDIEMQICELFCELYQYSDDEIFVTAIVESQTV